MNAGPLRASMFTLYERSPPTRPRDLWLEIANDLEHAIPERYQALSGRPYRLRINDTAEHSPSRRYVRYRTLNVSVRLKRDAPALLDACLGNWVFLASDLSEPLSTVDVPETGWIRSTTSVSLSEHLKGIRELVADLEDAGWQTSEAVLTPLELRMPSIETGQGVRSYDPSGLSRIASLPLWRPSRLKIGVLGLDNPSTPDAMVNRIAEAWQRIFRRSAPPISTGLTAPLDDESSATLVVIPDNVDLTGRADLCALLQHWEREGHRFKLARQSTTTKSYPMQNICFDLSILAGSVPWRPANEAVPAVSFDAGHDVKQRKSRWASAAMDSTLRVLTLRAIDSPLAEHMPEPISDAFWPTNLSSMVIRDGRLARERQSLDKRAVAEHRVLWEIKKHPVALVYRGSLDAALAARFGDAAMDPHGEILLQTLPDRGGDCIHPIRAKASGAVGDIQERTSELLMHSAAPSLSVYQQSRLPGAVYWADLASKLDRAGWSQVIGRGFGLGFTVPT